MTITTMLYLVTFLNLFFYHVFDLAEASSIASLGSSRHFYTPSGSLRSSLRRSQSPRPHVIFSLVIHMLCLQPLVGLESRQ